MTAQFELFNAAQTPRPEPDYPEGFRYQPDVLSVPDEGALLTRVRALPFQAFEFHGYTGNRRVVSYGWQYDFSGRRLRKAARIPDFLLDLRARAAAFAALAPEALEQILVTEYSPGAGIGWHRDKPVYGQVIGISLLASCVFRFRRATDNTWARINLTAAPRSVYLLSGPARTLWEHSIPPVSALRYSITFRTLRRDG